MVDGPLKRHLRDDLHEARIKEMWERIDHTPAPSRAPWRWAAVTAFALLLLFAGFMRFAKGPEPKPLALEAGVAPRVLGNDTSAVVPRFDDGSRLELRGGTRLEVLRNDGRSFVTVLRRGEATFDVKPGGRRHWIVEAGELSVEVVGTHFRVERATASTRVSVDHGIVLVRGERVPGGAKRLTAGMSFALESAPPHVPAPPTSAGSGAPGGVGESAPSTALDELQTAPSAAAAPKPSASAVPSVAPEPSAAVAPQSVVAAQEVDQVDHSLRSADSARQRGDGAAAIRHFTAAFEQAAEGDRRRGLAALSLARLLLNGDPARAARILRSSLADMPQALIEDAAVRLVEAESRAGNREGAARAAADYERRFPAGRRLDEVRRWSAP